MSAEKTTWTAEDQHNAEIDEALRENVRLGFVEITGKDKDGEILFRLTEKGITHVEELRRTDPEIREFYDSLWDSQP
jgi:DNA-binding PadR family transcriptional regulator